MKHYIPLLLPIIMLIGACGTSSTLSTASSKSRIERWSRALSLYPSDLNHPSSLRYEVNLKQMLIPRGVFGRHAYRPMKPKYITIHSTQNPNAGAWNHGRALSRGKLNGNTWHFTVQDDLAIQHLPTNEQGRHADAKGPGNRYSIGIEMCEHHGNSRAQTIDQTAKLTAYLMHEHGIPLSRVVPHQHWPREGFTPANKNCPHFLLDGGRKGRTWAWFKSRVKLHYNRV